LKRAAASTEVRADDNEETLKTRIATFRENTDKILVQYPSKLKQLNAERDVEPIFAEVVAAIDETLAKKA
jgi:adenylate kinase